MGFNGCSTCKGTGLLPFVKNGKVIPNVQIFCECQQDDTADYEPNPGEFDFPMSYDFRSFVEERYTGSPLPTLTFNRGETETKEMVVTYTGKYAELPQIGKMSKQVKKIQEELNKHITGSRVLRKPKYE